MFCLFRNIMAWWIGAPAACATARARPDARRGIPLYAWCSCASISTGAAPVAFLTIDAATCCPVASRIPEPPGPARAGRADRGSRTGRTISRVRLQGRGAGFSARAARRGPCENRGPAAGPRPRPIAEQANGPRGGRGPEARERAELEHAKPDERRDGARARLRDCPDLRRAPDGGDPEPRTPRLASMRRRSGAVVPPYRRGPSR
jgi:hypothetical protein